MDISYKILAADGKEYGPVDLQQLKTWVSEGRVSAETQLLRSDLVEWMAASRFAELSLSGAAPAFPGVGTVSPAAASSAALLELDKRVRSGGSWFYWVAALSLINSIVSFSGSGGGFVIGLAFTQLLDEMLSESGGTAKVIGLVVGIVAAGGFALLGVFSSKRHSWAFIVGIALYGFDTLLTVLAQHWLGLAFHAWVLVSLFVGLRASVQANALTEGN